jgi:hypothetical protein
MKGASHNPVSVAFSVERNSAIYRADTLARSTCSMVPFRRSEQRDYDDVPYGQETETADNMVSYPPPV